MPKTRHQYDMEMLQRELQYRKRIEQLSATVTATYEAMSTATLADKTATYIADTFD